MKTKSLYFTSALAAVSMAASAQNYSIDWHKVAGGGGASTGGVYAVTGTIGQHDAGRTLAGGAYSLTGGFWALVAVQTAGAPTLTIFRTTTNTVVVSWSAALAGWNLQQNTDLAHGSWGMPLETVNNNGTNTFIVINPPLGNRFFRLQGPG